MKLLEILFSDDLRLEINSKISIIGLYSGRIVIHPGAGKELKWPIQTRLATLLRLRFEGNDVHPDAFSVEYYINEKMVGKVEGPMTQDSSQPFANVAITLNQIPIEPGILGISVKFFRNSNIIHQEDEKAAIRIVTGQ